MRKKQVQKSRRAENRRRVEKREDRREKEKEKGRGKKKRNTKECNCWIIYSGYNTLVHGSNDKNLFV
jgi:hypothetical protein